MFQSKALRAYHVVSAFVRDRLAQLVFLYFQHDVANTSSGAY